MMPPGWKPFDANEWHPSVKQNLCHTDGLWIEAPDGHLYCGTCHPEPWLTHKPSPITMAST